MPGLTAIRVEAGFGTPFLDPAGNQVLDPAGNRILMPGFQHWADVLDDPINIQRGSFDSSPTARVADTGVMQLTLDNSNRNSAHQVGLYSPDHPNRRVHFQKGLDVQINLERASGDYYKFRGRITEIDPEPGLLSRKVTYVTISDWMDIAARTPLPRLAVQAGVRDDQVIETILAALDTPPAATNLDIGTETYPYALTDGRDEDDKVAYPLQSLMLSSLGRLFLTGGPSGGEVLTYQTLSTQSEGETPEATLDNSFLDMDPRRQTAKRVKRVLATVYPMEQDSAYVALASLAGSIPLDAGDSAEFTLYFRDTSGGGKNRVAALDVQTSVIDTDYKFSSVDGAGTDLNAYLSVEIFSPSGNSVKVRARNTHASATGYLWFFQARGKGMYRNDPLTYEAVDETISEAEGSTLDYRMPYQAAYATARDRANFLLEAYREDVTDLPSVDFNGGLSDTHMDYAVEIEPGHRVEILDSVTGIVAAYYIIGYKLTIRALNDVAVSWSVVPASLLGLFCKLDVVGRAELDSTAKLGF
jgi:hypothetical protein